MLVNIIPVDKIADESVINLTELSHIEHHNEINKGSW